jgi:phage gp36-like protein
VAAAIRHVNLPMAYATQDDLVPLRMTESELVQLTDDTKSGEVNADVVTAVLEEASGRVDSYCRGRYVTPLQPSDVVKALTLDIAVYLLFSRRRNAKMSDTVHDRFDQAMALLKDISTSKASIDQPGTQQTPQTSTGSAVVSGNAHPRFNEHDLKGFA